MKANAWHHRADAVSSVVALIGVGNILFPFVSVSYFSILFLFPSTALIISFTYSLSRQVIKIVFTVKNMVA